MLEVVPLGGLGEFGMNMLALTWGETTIVVDAGVMFPDPELLGVDRIIPDLTYLQQKGRAAALVLTHGHEDHIGAVPHVLPYVDGPVYGTPLTLALVEPKLAEHGIDGRTLIAVRPRDRVTIGPFVVEFIRVTHSVPDCVALAIHTPVGVIVHTGDFKIDQTPIDGEHFDVHRFAELGAAASSRCSRTAPTSTAAASRDRSAKSSKRSRRSSPAPPGAWSWPRLRRASTGCRFSSTSPRSSIARWRFSGAA